MNSKGQETYRFTIITPVHVGSGEKLGGNTDIKVEGNQCIVVDMESLFLKLKDNLSALNAFDTEEFNLSNLLKTHRINAGTVQKYRIANTDNIRFGFRFEIQEMIKTGMGKPYLPGSSIKGAIRTVILWHLTQTEDISHVLKEILNSDVKEQRADDRLDKELFGADPNHDFMRGLQTGDAAFELSDMKLIESKVLSLTDNGFGWKRMGRDGFNASNPQQATSLYCEGLKSGAVGVGTIKIEDFLFDNDLAKKALNFSGKKSLLMDLPQKCNEFAGKFIAEEITFFETCGMKEMAEFYHNLQKEIPEDNHSFLLHLGWGTGWRGMTGNFVEEDVLKEIRKRFGLGKIYCTKCNKEAKVDGKKIGYYFCFECKKSFPMSDEALFPVFPKTRKITFVNENPHEPLGWVKIERITADKKEAESAVSVFAATIPQQSEFMQHFEDFRLRPAPENFRKFIETIKPENMAELEQLSFVRIKEHINIGFVKPLSEAEISEEVRKVLAVKMLEVIQKGKKWSIEKLENYKKLETFAGKK